jgi:diguanylate cyclase
MDVVAPDKVNETARRALDLARQHDLPLLPNVFDVLFRYCAGTTEGVSAFIDGRMVGTERLDLDTVMDCWDRCVGPHAIHEGLESVSNNLNRGMDRLFAQVESGIDSQTKFAGDLKEGLSVLASSGDRNSLRDVARKLYQSNHNALSASHDFAQELARSHQLLREARAELETLRETAFIDHLTQLPNRRRLERALDDAVSESASQHKPLCVAVLDIDHFKKVNDTWGHLVGDNVLRRVGRLLRQNVKGRDLAARAGGEEFALVLPATRLQDASRLVESIRQQMEEVVWVRETDEAEIGVITLSAGIAQWQSGETAAKLMDRADKELYRAKASGRNRVSLAA